MSEGERQSITDEAIAAAAAAIEEQKAQEELPPFITFSNGLKLRLRPVPQTLLAQVTGRIGDPEPPQVDLGKGRLEANPDDPDYLAELDRRKQVRAGIGGNSLIVFGTAIEELPPGLRGPEDTVWIDEVHMLDALGVDEELETPLKFPHANPAQRYLSWLSYYALPKGEDLEQLSHFLLRLGGVTEEEVAAAMATFPGAKGRGTAPGGAPASPAPDRANRQQRRARADTAPRRARSR